MENLPRNVYTIGVDIGGTHVSAAAVDPARGKMLEAGRTDFAVEPTGSPDEILGLWAAAIREAMSAGEGASLAGIGIAMPGPFDYPNGISLIQGLGKYDRLYGMNIRSELAARLEIDPAAIPILFMNDAACFLLGEFFCGAAHGSRKAIGITLGTGFGSAFLADGRILETGVGVPPNGWLYNASFHGRTAEDHFSARGLMARHVALGGDRLPGVRELCDRARQDALARSVMEEYGALLGEFLAPWVRTFGADHLVVGGNISRASALFFPQLERFLHQEMPELQVRRTTLHESAAMIGAAHLPVGNSFRGTTTSSIRSGNDLAP